MELQCQSLFGMFITLITLEVGRDDIDRHGVKPMRLKIVEWENITFHGLKKDSRELLFCQWNQETG
ncbi:MAG: hypothetical protein D3908_13215 [Candidatus Electrothrix sp. AUS4]|nr:hypothetical protein [Candidatus Electrothrix sp. AUS4]